MDAKTNGGPGPQRQGPENRGSTIWGISAGFPSLEILRKMFEFSANVWERCDFPAPKSLESMITIQHVHVYITGVHHGFDMKRKWNGRLFVISSLFSLGSPLGTWELVVASSCSCWFLVKQ